MTNITSFQDISCSQFTDLRAGQIYFCHNILVEKVAGAALRDLNIPFQQQANFQNGCGLVATGDIKDR